MSVFPFRMPKSLPAVHGTKVSHNIGTECILFTLCTEHCKCNSSIGYYLIMGGTGITHHNRIHKWRGCLRATFSTHYANLNIWILLKEFLDCHTFSTVHSALHILSTVRIVNKFTWDPAPQTGQRHSSAFGETTDGLQNCKFFANTGYLISLHSYFSHWLHYRATTHIFKCTLPHKSTVKPQSILS